jgi:hypothetical protein
LHLLPKLRLRLRDKAKVWARDKVRVRDKARARDKARVRAKLADVVVAA